MTYNANLRHLPETRMAGIKRLFSRHQLVALAATLSIMSGTAAQAFTTDGGGSPITGTQIAQLGEHFEAPRTSPSSTILPTDVVPLPQAQERTSFGENLQLRVLQRLPAPFYFNASVEGSFREETNVFQFPTKRKLIQETVALQPGTFRQLNAFTQSQLMETLNRCSAFDTVFRILPNLTWGWAFKPRTRVYGNYFMIRDQLTHWTTLNTVIHSLGYGIQQDIPVGRRGNLQADMQFRELWQLHSKPRFDFLPGLTFSYVLTPRMVLFANSLFQMRGKGYFHSPNTEMDPFYTWGGYYAKNGWAFSATTTFVQNFRAPFHSQATIPINNYSFISDFEIARRLVRQVPGFQVFARAEPIWNFHSHGRPGLSGMDFRMFFGFRMQLGKPALTAAYEQIKQQLEEQETAPPPPGKSPGEAKPSAYLQPYQITADNSQPMHGLFQADLTIPVATVYPGHMQEAPASAEKSNAVSANFATDAPQPVASTGQDVTVSNAGGAMTLAAGDNASSNVPAVLNVANAPSRVDGSELVMLAPALAIQPSRMDAQSGELNTETIAKTRQARAEKHKRESANAKIQHDQLDKKAKANREVEMVVVPPLPTVNADSKENPFQNSGLDLKPPIVINTIH